MLQVGEKVKSSPAKNTETQISSVLPDTHVQVSGK